MGTRKKKSAAAAAEASRRHQWNQNHHPHNQVSNGLHHHANGISNGNGTIPTSNGSAFFNELSNSWTTSVAMTSASNTEQQHQSGSRRRRRHHVQQGRAVSSHSSGPADSSAAVLAGCGCGGEQCAWEQPTTEAAREDRSIGEGGWLLTDLIRGAGGCSSNNNNNNSKRNCGTGSHCGNTLELFVVIVQRIIMDYIALGPCLLAAVLYMNTLRAEFAYDDSRAILKNPDLLPSTPLSSLFYDDFWGTPLTHSGSHKSYRPLCVLTFRINYQLGAFDPWGYHLGNVLLHVLVTGLFTYTARLLLWRRTASLVAGALFASHPIHTEAVAGIVGRADILSCMFFLLAFLSYVRYCRLRNGDLALLRTSSSPSNSPSLKSPGARPSPHRWPWLLMTATCTLAAMLSKELGITVLAVCGVYDMFLVCRVRIKDFWKIFQVRYRPLLEGLLCLAAIGTSLVVFRIVFMGSKPPEFAPADNPASDSPIWLTRALTFNYLPCVNLWLLLFPKVLSFDWSMGAVPLVESLTDLRNICTLSLYSVLVYTAYYLIQKMNIPFPMYTAAFTDGDHSGTGSSGSKPKMHNGNGFAHHSHHNSTHSTSNHNHHQYPSYDSSPRSVWPVHIPWKPGWGSGGDAGSSVQGVVGVAGVRRRLHTRRGSGSSTDSGGSQEDSTRSSPRRRKSALPSPAYNDHCYPQTQHSLHVLALSLALLVFPFIPATNLFFYVGFVVAERVLYIPSLGFCLLVAHGIDVVLRRHSTSLTVSGSRRIIHAAARIAVVILLVSYSFRTVLRNEDWTTEEKLYRAGISVNPAKAWGNLANILNNQGNHREAEEAYRNALKHRANMADVHYNLGILLQEQKRYKEAIESYRLAIQCRPRLTMAHLNLGIVYANLGFRTEAEEMYKTCAEIDISGLKDPRLHEQTKISALYNLGRLLADQEKYVEAIDTYQEAIRRRPAHYAPQSLYNMLGEAYSKLSVPRLEEAEFWYLEALKAKPGHIPAHLTMGKLRLRQGRVDEAETWFRRARDLDPEESSIYQHYGQFLSDVGRHQEAADSYVTAANFNPQDFELVFNTANALRQAQRNEDAEEFYRRAVILQPKEATAHMNLGAMLHFNGKHQEAERSYLAALQLRPDDQITQNNLQKVRNLIKSRANNNNNHTKR